MNPNTDASPQKRVSPPGKFRATTAQGATAQPQEPPILTTPTKLLPARRRGRLPQTNNTSHDVVLDDEEAGEDVAVDEEDGQTVADTKDGFPIPRAKSNYSLSLNQLTSLPASSTSGSLPSRTRSASPTKARRRPEEPQEARCSGSP